MPVSKRARGSSMYSKLRTKRTWGATRPISRSRRARRPRSKFARKVMRVVNLSADVKETMLNIATNVSVLHNDILNLHQNAFYSDNGVHGESMTGISGQLGNRIGTRIFCKGIQVAMHIENQQYRPNVIYTLYLIRNKVSRDLGLTTKPQIFEGLNTTIPLDYIDTSKVDIMFSKKFKVKQDGMGTTLAAGAAGVFDTSEVQGVLPDLYEGINTVVTNGRWMGKFYVPVNKTIHYQDYDSGDASFRVPATMRYQWVITAYDNRSTGTGNATWPLGHVNMTTKMKFTDV